VCRWRWDEEERWTSEAADDDTDERERERITEGTERARRKRARKEGPLVVDRALRPSVNEVVG